MLRVRVITLLLCLPFSLHLFAGSTKASSDQSGLDALVERLQKISTISGSFVQYSVDQKGVRVQESHGEFKAKRPDFFYWRTEEPLEQEIYSDGERVTVYDPDLEQATIQKTNVQTETTPAALFSGDPARISELFEVEHQELDKVVSQFLLTPKSNDSLFERLRVRFDGAQLTQMRLSDSLGQDSTVSFIHTEVNMALPDSAFVPTFPSGTDIIEDLPASFNAVN